MVTLSTSVGDDLDFLELDTRDSNGGPIYAHYSKWNKRQRYLYHDSDGHWAVSQKLVDIHACSDIPLIHDINECVLLFLRGFIQYVYLHRLEMITRALGICIISLAKKNVPVHVAMNGTNGMAMIIVLTVPSMFTVSISFSIIIYRSSW